MLWSKALSVLSAELGLRALKKNAAVVTAESCTAGGIANAIAATPGASAWLKGGWVTYQTSQKIDWLGVPEELIASEGVVSEAVAEAMARGALARTPTASHAVATTGVAGPSGGTDDTPVGAPCRWPCRDSPRCSTGKIPRPCSANSVRVDSYSFVCPVL